MDDWSRMTHLQLGRHAELLVTLEFLRCGYEVYRAEVDERGIDLLVRTRDGGVFDIQVKSSRNLNYIFYRKESFPLRENVYGGAVLYLEKNPPQAFLIPSIVWSEPSELFVSRDYSGLKSKPEWGMNLSQKNLKLLEPIKIGVVLAKAPFSVS